MINQSETKWRKRLQALSIKNLCSHQIGERSTSNVSYMAVSFIVIACCMDIISIKSPKRASYNNVYKCMHIRLSLYCAIAHCVFNARQTCMLILCTYDVYIILSVYIYIPLYRSVHMYVYSCSYI